MANLLGTTVNGALSASGRISVTYDTNRYQFNFNRTSASNWWVTNDSTALGLHVDNVGDKFYFSTAGDFWSSTNGWLSTALAGKLSLSGGTMSGDIIFPNDSSAGLRNAAANAGFRLDDQYGNMYSYNLAGGYYVDATSYYFRSAAAANWMTISGGTVTATGDFRAPIFYDSQDTNYYVDPNSTSKLVQVNLGTVNTRLISDVGVGYLKIYGSASNYLGVGPYDNNGWVYFENIGNSTGIYFNSPGRYAFDSVDVTPYTDNENSLGNGSYRWANIYTGGWLRNYGAQGMYNESYGTHFYSNTAEGFAITGSGGVVQLQFRSNHQSTSRGYVYADTSNNIGFLNDGGSWALRMSSTRNAEIFGSDLTIGAGGANSTNIIMGDNDEGGRTIHCNSNRIGFLTQGGSWGSWSNDDGSWQTDHAVYAPIYYDSANTTYYFNGDSTTSLRTKGSWRADSADWDGEYSGKIQYHANNWYFQSASAWLFRSSGGSNVVSISQGGNISVNGYVGDNSGQTRDKLRVWDSSTYTIGMKSGYNYGHLGTDQYAMSFQMNSENGRGFWWGDNAHSDNEGAASLTTDGRMVIAKSLSIGEGEAVLSPSSTPLYVKGTTSGADVVGVDGINGRLFTVTDDLSGSLFSVNTIAGLPVIEAFADNTVTIGKYGYATTWSTTGFMTVPNSANIYRDLFINGGRSGDFGNRLIIGTDATTYTMNDSNQRPTAYLHGQYPVLTLNHTVTGNTSHGPTIQFTHHTADKQWVIGSNGTGTRLDIGYSTNTNRNPHNGIDDLNGSTFIRVDNSGNVQLGRGAGRSTWVNDILYVGASDSGDSHMYFGEDSSNWYGLHWYWDSGHIVYLYGRNAGTDTEIMRYTTNSNTYVEWRRNFHMNNYEINYLSQLHFNAGTRFVGNDTHYLNFKADAVDYGSIHVRDGNNTLRGYLGYFDSSGFGLLNSSGSWGIRFDPTNAGTDIFYAGGLKLRTLSGGARIYGDLFLDENYGYGIVGVYSAERYQGVFAMGNAYKLAADGQGTGNLYGLAWTHTNVGGQSKAGLEHQLLVMNYGTTLTAIGNGIWTAGTITTVNHGNSSQWNTAYGWGNHAGLYSLVGHVHTFASITSKPTTIAGYGITDAYTDTQIQNFFNGANAITGYNKSNWDTAYGWGNHASADYIVRGTQIASSASWGTATRFGSVGDISQAAGNHALSVRSEDGNDAFMSFHVGGDYAVHFGLDRVSNRMHVGGWSDGTGNKYQIWDSRDFSSTNISNWNTAYGWGNHAGLYAAAVHNHDDRYYTESESDSRFVNASGDTMNGSLSFDAAAVIKKKITGVGDNPVKTASGVLASRSDNGGGYVYYVIETNVPQDDYQMGGFTIELFGAYGSTNNKTKIDLGGYWNTEANGGFQGFEAHGTNPQYKPTIEVARNSAGKTAFIIYGASWSYPIIVARDLWLGYSQTDGGTYGEGWSITGTNDVSSYTNKDTVVWRNAYSDSNPSGYITGNQTITLSGDVSGSGTTSIVVTVNDIDGWGFVNTGSNSPINADTINSNGISYYTAGVTNFSGNATDGALYSQRYSDSWQHQIAGDYRSGMIAVRGKNNGTWTSWKTIIDSSTIGSQSVNYATSAGSASSATIASTVTVNSGNTSAGWYPIVWHSGNTVYSSSGVEIYAAGNYIRSQYINTTDNDESGITRFVIKNGDSYHRSATTTVAADIIRGVASGSWSINVTGSSGSTTGNAATATNVAWSGVTSKPAGWLDTGALVQDMEPSATAFPSGFYQSYLGAGNPTGTWFNYINVRHSNTGNGHGFQLGMSYYDTNLWFRSYQGSLSPTFSAWAYAISSLNIASQSVNYATSAGSATSSTTATTANRLERYGVIYGNNWNDYYLNNRFIAASAHNATGTNKPDGAYNYGSTLSYYNSGEDHYQIYVTENSVNSNGKDRKMYYRSGWNGSWGGWRSVVDVYNSVCYIDAAVTATGDITAFSDGRVKENVKTLEGALDKTLKLRGVSYNRTDIEDKSTKIGVIAQEILEVVPEVVSQDENGMYAVSYGNITALLIEAIKEQQKQIDELKEIINGLTK